MMMPAVLRAAFIALWLADASALQLRAPLVRAQTRRCASPLLMSEEESKPEDTEYTVDWDTAWKKEVSMRDEGAASWRPEGREPVTEQQLAEVRVKRTVDDAQFNLQAATKVDARAGPNPHQSTCVVAEPDC